MYPIGQGYEEANNRLDALLANGHSAEALLASVFAMEKTIRRSLRFCVMNRGLSSKQCNIILSNKGFRDMVDMWPVFEKEHRSLPEFVGQAFWQHVQEAVTMRNKMVHGSRVYDLKICAEFATKVRAAMGELRTRSVSELNCDPWKTLPGKIKPELVWLKIRQPNTMPAKSCSMGLETLPSPD